MTSEPTRITRFTRVVRSASLSISDLQFSEKNSNYVICKARDGLQKAASIQDR